MRYEWAAPAAYPRPESPGSGTVFVPSAPYKYTAVELTGYFRTVSVLLRVRNMTAFLSRNLYFPVSL